MAISAKDVMALRKATGLGMMESKAALEEAGGDMQAAQDLLRTKGLAKMDGRSDRESAEGKVAVAVTADGSKGAIVEINTETDFTASNEAFVNLTQAVADLALEQGDILAVRSSGAYGFSMSSNYNTRPRAAEIMVDGDIATVVRERETLLQLMQGEHILPV